MGICFSLEKSTHEVDQHRPQTAKFVSINGDLKEFPVPITVSQVLVQLDISNSSFICNSDALFFDELITALKMEDQLQANQLYFLLPLSKLEHPLTASDMTSLAVKASVALQNSSDFGKEGHCRKKVRISPAMFSDNCNSEQSETIRSSSSDGLLISHTYSHDYENEITIGHGPRKKQRDLNLVPGISRSVSVKKIQRYASKRALSAVNSFKLRLSTIYEATAF